LVEADLAVKDETMSGKGFNGRVKLTGCIVERFVPNMSAEFIRPLIVTRP
jgi:hypothetical protein